MCLVLTYVNNGFEQHLTSAIGTKQKVTESMKHKVFCERPSIAASCNYETNGLNRGVLLRQLSKQQLPRSQDLVAFLEPRLRLVRISKILTDMLGLA